MVVCLSNHWHLVLTDVKGNVSAFLRTTHMLIGKAVNAFRGRREALWQQGRLNLARLMTPEDILNAMVYCVTNPVKHNQVATYADWPGWVTSPEHLLSHVYETERPGRFFSKRVALGERTSFQLMRPPGFESMTDEAFVQLFAERVAVREQELTEVRGDAEVVGAAAVLSKRYYAKPKKREKWFQRVPQFKCHDTDLRCRVLAGYQAFVAEYTKARIRFERGVRNAVFPHGALLLRKRFGVRVRGPDRGCVLANK